MKNFFILNIANLKHLNFQVLEISFFAKYLSILEFILNIFVALLSIHFIHNSIFAKTKILFCFNLVEWWNWQTRMFKGHVPRGVGVQVPLRPPNPNIEL